MPLELRRGHCGPPDKVVESVRAQADGESFNDRFQYLRPLVDAWVRGGCLPDAAFQK